ncbi:replication endonuclease [Citrobacter farmeri]|uniref:replication endonuclease n=1 Tax=Citrobacter farmeri TaxID=67824 RepID=UPI0019037B55|nr:replication endonuclease [Citrobacter farmeri]MBJ9165089.1 replication endonuclease [Citrobacter farmeri]
MGILQSIQTDMERLKQVSPYLFNSVRKSSLLCGSTTARPLREDDIMHTYFSELLSRTLVQLNGIKTEPLLPLINLNDYEVSKLAEKFASTKKPYRPDSDFIAANEILKHLSGKKCGSSRLSSPRWWETQLRKKIDRLKEKLFISMGLVQKRVSPFISREMFYSGQKKSQERINFLSTRKAINASTEQETDFLLRMAMSGIANPRIQKSELTQILFGTYKYATQCDHVCIFFTITLPPRFHAITFYGKPCKNWSGSTPRDSHKELEVYWKKIRSALSKILFYGTRVVEPHYDGTPHWHIVIYMPRKDEERVVSTFKKYLSNIIDSPSENRILTYKSVKNEAILPYLIKFMASSIPGVADEKAVDDVTGELLSRQAQKVKQWASLWRIRRFQHFGLPEIGTWRECRRIRSTNITHELGSEAEAVRCAADHGDFALYIETQGGVGIKRSVRTLQVAREISPFENIWGEEKTISIGIKITTSTCYKIFRTRTTYFAQQSVKFINQTPFLSLPSNIVNNCRDPMV